MSFLDSCFSFFIGCGIIIFFVLGYLGNSIRNGLIGLLCVFIIYEGVVLIYSAGVDAGRNETPSTSVEQESNIITQSEAQISIIYEDDTMIILDTPDGTRVINKAIE